MKWEVNFTSRSLKQVKNLALAASVALRLLVEELERRGPSLPDWPNYGKLHGKKREDKRFSRLKHPTSDTNMYLTYFIFQSKISTTRFNTRTCILDS